MRYVSFRIKNFKGISDQTIDLEKYPNAHIFALVGPNESGKTTILEAIHNFKKNDENIPIIQMNEDENVNDFLHIDGRDNFTGNIELIATINLNEEDKESIVKSILESFKVEWKKDFLPSEISIVRRHVFDKGDLKLSEDDLDWKVSPEHFVSTNPQAQPAKPAVSEQPQPVEASQGEAPQAEAPQQESIPQPAVCRNLNEQERKRLAGVLYKSLPKILYFPNLLSEFPDKIYLSPNALSNPVDAEKNAFYVQIISDILHQLDGRTIQKHILERVDVPEHAQSLQATLNLLGNTITTQIVTAWNDILGRKFGNRMIWVKQGKEKLESGQENDFLQFYVKENNSSYSIRQRSLGFRWFFCFFLFTLYRDQSPSKLANSVLLIDEPASNLHPAAQKKLRKSLTKITDRGFTIIYSTHSPHLIEPSWLEATFVAKNLGTNYQEAVNEDVIRTDIVLTPYRRFVSENPTDTTYFQPVMDALEYTPSDFDEFPSAVMVEGKNDFYGFVYFRDIIFKDEYDSICIMPGDGNGKLGTLISLYQGWGREFMVLLDDDESSETCKQNYIKEHLLNEGQVLTLGDVDKSLQGMRFEDLISDTDKQKLFDKFMPHENRPADKKALARILQELIAREELFQFDRATLDNMNMVLNVLDKKMETLLTNKAKKAA